MTFSVLVRDDSTGELGGGVASKFLAAGSSVVHLDASAGAIATQAYADISFGPRGLQLLALGVPAATAVEVLLQADAMASRRQLAALGLAGEGAAYSGAECMDVACHRAGPGFSCQGNVLASPAVVDAMAEVAAVHVPGRPTAETVLAALEAGDAAGGDRRGRQSAGLRAVRAGCGYAGTTDTILDLRVDDHDAPLPELRRLVALHAELFSRPGEDELRPLEGALLGRVVTALRAVTGEPLEASDRAAVWRALDRWASWENYEERLVRELAIDAVLLAALERAADGAPGS